MYYPNFRLNSNKVPILSAEEINIIAERFVSDFINEADGKIIPFDIEKFLEFYLQVEMEYEDLSQDKSCLGMTVFNNSSRIIAYDSINNRAKYISAHEGTIIIDNSLLESGQEKRLRFTLGHEAGHWIFHKAFYGYNPGQLTLFEMDNPFTRCRSINSNYLYQRTKNWDDDKWMEWQADKFSAGILMPRSYVNDFMSENFLRCNNNTEIEQTIRTISDFFQVSKQAAFYRLCDLKFIETKDENETNHQLSIFDMEI